MHFAERIYTLKKNRDCKKDNFNGIVYIYFFFCATVVHLGPESFHFFFFLIFLTLVVSMRNSTWFTEANRHSETMSIGSDYATDRLKFDDDLHLSEYFEEWVEPFFFFFFIPAKYLSGCTVTNGYFVSDLLVRDPEKGG